MLSVQTGYCRVYYLKSGGDGGKAEQRSACRLSEAKDFVACSFDATNLSKDGRKYILYYWFLCVNFGLKFFPKVLNKKWFYPKMFPKAKRENVCYLGGGQCSHVPMPHAP